jgi:hypothetical protein
MADWNRDGAWVAGPACRNPGFLGRSASGQSQDISALHRYVSNEICPPYDAGRGGAADVAGGANRPGSSRVVSTFSSVCRML